MFGAGFGNFFTSFLGNMTASAEAHALDAYMRWRVKPRMRNFHDFEAGDVRAMHEELLVFDPQGVVIEPGEVGGVRGEWLRQEGAEPGRPTLLYLHGGGYFACSPETHRAITVRLARRGFTVFAPDYRLAPEHPFPAAIDDALAAWRGLLAGGVSPREAVIAGDSAGGGLAAAVLLAAKAAGEPLPAAAALLSPWTDLAATGESIRDNDWIDATFHGDAIAPGAQVYLAGADPRDPLASPLYGDLAGLPPLIIHVGEREVLLDDSIRLAERARAAGVEVTLKIWPVVPHVFQAAPFLPESRQSLNEIARFLHRALAAAGKSEMDVAAE